MREARIVGYKKFVSKKGNPMCVVSLTFPYTDKEAENLGAIGEDVFTGFVPRGFDIDVINENCLGKSVDVAFSFYNEQVNLVYLNIC